VGNWAGVRSLRGHTCGKGILLTAAAVADDFQKAPLDRCWRVIITDYNIIIIDIAMTFAVKINVLPIILLLLLLLLYATSSVFVCRWDDNGAAWLQLPCRADETTTPRKGSVDIINQFSAETQLILYTYMHTHASIGFKRILLCARTTCIVI